MKKLTYKLILLLIAGSFVSLHATEPVFKNEFTREVHETFDVSSGVNLEVQNKHGDIVIDTWNKNQIQIDVLIKVKSSNAENAQKFLDAIDIDFSSSASRVSAVTVYPDNNKSWWSGWFGNNKNLDYEVHYTINAPSDMSTAIVNKYGNITQASISGDCDVTNKYGDIFYEDISGDLDLSLGYGKATFGTVGGDASMEVKYSTVRIINTNDLNASTKYSKIKIKSCGRVISQTKYDEYKIESMTSLKNDGKYDDFMIGSIENIDIDTKYTDVNISTLHNRARFDTRYGHINVKATGNDLETIGINSKYTNYNFTINGDFHLAFDGSRTDLHVNKPYEKYLTDKDGSDLKLKAYRGSKDGGARISANMRYGGLDIN